MEELEPSAKNAKKFAAAIQDAKAGAKHGAAVYVYPEVEYQDMRLFLSEDGKSGMAIKPDGDIVSVFSDGGGKAHSMLTLAVEEGGNKLDAFDTALPDIYAVNGFKETGRAQWDEEQKPEGWDKEAFSPFNGGEPDVVFMEYDEGYNPFEDDTRYSLREETNGQEGRKRAGNREGRGRGGEASSRRWRHQNAQFKKPARPEKKR